MSQYVIYCRKSTESEEKQVLSIESQVKELKELRDRLNLPASDILIECKSAKLPGRTIFNDMMKKIYKGQYAGVICWKLDRLARNPLDGSSLVWALDQGKLKEILTPHGCFKNNSNDKFMMQIEFGMAKKYVDDLSDNIKRGIRAKLELGWLPFLPPLGYLNEPKDRTIIKDPERFNIVRQAWDLLLQRMPLSSILDTLNNRFGLRTRSYGKKGGTPLTISGLYKLFGNPFYYGVINLKENVYLGKHDPMITEDEFWQAQDILGRPGRPRPKKHAFAFTGLIKCGECGAMITAEEKINRYGSHYVYYHCTKKKSRTRCHQKCVNLTNLEEQIIRILRRSYVPQLFCDILLEYLSKTEKEESNTPADIHRSLERALADCEKKLKTLNQMRLKELIDDEEYKREKIPLLNDKLSLEKNNKKNYQKISIDQTRSRFVFAAEALNRFINGSLEDKRYVLAHLGSNPALRDKIFTIETDKPLLMIENVLKILREKNVPVEPDINGFNTTDIGLFVPHFPLLWSLVNDVRTFYESLPVSEESLL